jgi:hypothetical protein
VFALIPSHLQAFEIQFSIMTITQPLNHLHMISLTNSSAHWAANSRFSSASHHHVPWLMIGDDDDDGDGESATHGR